MTRKAKQKIGKLLMESLTSDQITCLLDVVFLKTDIDPYMDSLKKADPDMAETVQNMFKMSTEQIEKASKGLRVASNLRILEHWNSLWRHWDDIVSEVGDEGGKYAVQEAHWEPPYFDGSLLADDLEPIAGDMLGLIDEVYELIEEPDLFFEALEEISDNILSYPEWMAVESHEGCTLEKNVTCCMLKWLWLSIQNDSNPGKAFLDKVYEIEKSFEMVGLDDNECIDFFVNLPKEVCRDIYVSLNKNTQQYNLDNVYLRWHKLHHIYEETFDSAKYLETCKKHLAGNWGYGPPLIRDAFENGDHETAEAYLEKTFSSYLNKSDKTKWNPETSLLQSMSYYHSSDEKEAVAELLDIWTNVSEKLDNPKRSAAARLQSVIFRASEDWDRIIREYRKLLDPEVHKVIEPLFFQWKDKMAGQSVRHDSSKASADTWIHWLIDAELDKTGKKEGFDNKLADWLAQLNKNDNAFKNQWQMLARLTKDLPNRDKLKNQYPTFFDEVLPGDASSDLGKARLAGLDKMDAGVYISTITGIWKKHLHRVLPDPSNAHKSDYTTHARWMRALYELDRDEYHRVLTKWRSKHNRRRNLWRDMKAQKLPL